MRHLAVGVLLWSSSAVAAPPGPAVPASLMGQNPNPPQGESAENAEQKEEASEASSAQQPGAPSGAGPKEQGPSKASEPGATKPSEPTPSPSANPKAQTLVSGAPIYNPNVAVHIVERKLFSDKGKHELALFPAVAQLNGKFTQHFGTALSYTYHLHENFAIQFTPLWNWFNTESEFNQELINKVREEAQAATSLLLSWGVLGGVEVVPLYGKFAWYEESLLQYRVVITGAAGYGGTRHQLKLENERENTPATFGDTGNRFLGSIGAGFRVQFGDRFAVRLEVRDVVYTARVDRVNGCDSADFQILDADFRAGKDPALSSVKEGCRAETFSLAEDRANDIPLARSLVAEPTSDVLNLVGLYAGASFNF
jgi:outer membrane beta-barrel protein